MSNRLPILAAEAERLHREVLAHERGAAEKALALGTSLAEARLLCPHGAWGPFLAGAGIPERTAQRYLALHRVALTPATVAGLGGVAAAAAWAGGVRLPRPGSCLLVEVDGLGHPPLALVWPVAEGHHVGHLNLDGEGPYASVTERPLVAEWGVWATCWHLLGERLAELTFTTVPDDLGALAVREVMEAGRDAA